MYKEYLLDDAEGTLGIEDEIAFLSSEIVSPQQATRLPLYIPTEAYLIQPRHVADGPCPYYRALWTAAMTTDCSPTLQTSPVVKDRHGTRSEKNPSSSPPPLGSDMSATSTRRTGTGTGTGNRRKELLSLIEAACLVCCQPVAHSLLTPHKLASESQRFFDPYTISPYFPVLTQVDYRPA